MITLLTLATITVNWAAILAWTPIWIGIALTYLFLMWWLFPCEIGGADTGNIKEYLQSVLFVHIFIAILISIVCWLVWSITFFDKNKFAPEKTKPIVITKDV